MAVAISHNIERDAMPSLWAGINGAADAVATRAILTLREIPRYFVFRIVLLYLVTQSPAVAHAYQQHLSWSPPSYTLTSPCKTDGRYHSHCGRDASPTLKGQAQCPIPLTLRDQPQVLTIKEQRADLEWALGTKLASEVDPHLEFINDFVVIQYMNRLEQTITGSVGLVGCFTVKVIENDDFNAYALPGGFIYITSGLILSTDSEDELAAALAHETAHVVARHYSRIQAKRQTWGRLALAGGPAGYLVRSSFGTLLTMKLLRNAEFEADRLGLEYFSAAGYNTADFTRVLQRAIQEEGEPVSFFERLFDNHPLITSRIKRLERLKPFGAIQQSRRARDSAEFHQVKARISTLLSNDTSQP